MNFSTWSIRNPVPAVLLFILLTATGLIAFDRLSVQEFSRHGSSDHSDQCHARGRGPRAA